MFQWYRLLRNVIYLNWTLFKAIHFFTNLSYCTFMIQLTERSLLYWDEILLIAIQFSTDFCSFSPSAEVAKRTVLHLNQNVVLKIHVSMDLLFCSGAVVYWKDCCIVESNYTYRNSFFMDPICCSPLIQLSVTPMMHLNRTMVIEIQVSWCRRHCKLSTRYTAKSVINLNWMLLLRIRYSKHFSWWY